MYLLQRKRNGLNQGWSFSYFKYDYYILPLAEIK